MYQIQRIALDDRRVERSTLIWPDVRPDPGYVAVALQRHGTTRENVVLNLKKITRDHGRSSLAR